MEEKDYTKEYTNLYIGKDGLCTTEKDISYTIEGMFEPSIFYGVTFFGNRLENSEK